MDSLDCLDLDMAHRKSHRVRSWYLYEQYKSLERNQLDATQQLKNKSYQEKILRQELDERKARRRLCDHFGYSQSETILERPGKRNIETLSSSTEDIFESFCELHEENELVKEDDYSYDSSHTSNNYDDFKSLENKKAEDSCSESVNSIVGNITYEDGMTSDLKEELEIVKHNIAENLNLQLETVKENIERLENYSKLHDEGKISEDDSLDSRDRCEQLRAVKAVKSSKITEVNSVLAMWSKLVTFAYQLIQLNHGNCYFDYSSQFMTAVLACDVLRRGIGRPYISPVKYATSESDTSAHELTNEMQKKSFVYEKSSKTIQYTGPHSKNKIRRHYSENKWQYRSKCFHENRCNEFIARGVSEPWRSVDKFSVGNKRSEKSSRKLSRQFTKAKFSERNLCKCRCLDNVVNPIRKLARYIDSILQDVEN